MNIRCSVIYLLFLTILQTHSRGFSFVDSYKFNIILFTENVLLSPRSSNVATNHKWWNSQRWNFGKPMRWLWRQLWTVFTSMRSHWRSETKVCNFRLRLKSSFTNFFNTQIPMDKRWKRIWLATIFGGGIIRK